MLTIGLTGGIGSGKSTIAHYFKQQGYPVYDTDSAAKHIIVHNPAVRSQIEVLFGSEVFDGDHYRTDIVSQIVFQQPDILHRLNAIAHPAVAFDLKHWIEKNQESGFRNQDSGIRTYEFLFVESAILYESGLDALCDKVVEITAPIEVRVQRIMQRDGLSKAQVLARIHAQALSHPQADMILINDGETPVATIAAQLRNRLLKQDAE